MSPTASDTAIHTRKWLPGLNLRMLVRFLKSSRWIGERRADAQNRAQLTDSDTP
jgi:hypothetical protein